MIGDVAVVLSVGLDHQETLGDSYSSNCEGAIFKKKERAVIGVKLAEEARRAHECAQMSWELFCMNTVGFFIFKRDTFQSR